MGNIIKTCDQFGEDFTLNYGSNKQKKSIKGGILSIFLMIFVTIGSITFIVNYFSTKDPEVSTNTKTSTNFPVYNLSESNIFPMLGVLKNDEIALTSGEISKYVTIYGIVNKMTYSQSQTADGQTLLVNEKINEFRFDPCKEVNTALKGKLYSGIQNFQAYGENACLCGQIKDEENYKVEGAMTQVPFITYNIKFFPCSLEDQSQCKSKQDIMQAQFNVLNLVPSFDKEEFDNPVTFRPISLLKTFLNYNQGKIINIQLKKNILYDETMDYLGEKLKKEYAEMDSIRSDIFQRDENQIYCTDTEIRDGKCAPYINIKFSAGGKSTTIKRNYKKPSELMGDIGGINEVFLIIFSFLFVVVSKFCKEDKEELGLGKDGSVEILKTLRNGLKDKKDMEKVLEEFEKVNYDGFEVIRSLSKLKILEGAVFEDYHRTLVPIIALSIIKRNLKMKEDKFSQEEKLLSLGEAVEKLKNDRSLDPFKKKINEFFLENLPENLKWNDEVRFLKIENENASKTEVKSEENFLGEKTQVQEGLFRNRKRGMNQD